MALAAPISAGELQAKLAAAADGLRVGLERRQMDGLLNYVALLQRWNAVHNLSSANDATALMHHVVDCLAIIGPLTQRMGRHGVRALDAGTGAGLPAVVLSIMFPEWAVTAVDTVGKKIAFVRQVAGELRLKNLQPIHARLERMTQDGNDVITSRAFGSLRQFVEQTRHLLLPNGCWAAMKGKLPDSEIRDLPPNCQLFHVEPLAVPELDADRCLVWLRPAEPDGNRP